MKVLNLEAIKSVAIVLTLSLWSPILWALAIPGIEGGVLGSWKEFSGYALYPVLILWIGNFPLSLAVVLTYRRVGLWVLLSGVFSLFISIGAYLIVITFEYPNGGGFVMDHPGPGPGKFTEHMIGVAMVTTISSGLVWMHLGLWTASQGCRKQ